MLCLNCIHARGEIPRKLEVEVGMGVAVEKIDIANQLKKLWKAMEEEEYTTIVFCDVKKEVKVGLPPSPASTITECKEFAEA